MYQFRIQYDYDHSGECDMTGRSYRNTGHFDKMEKVIAPNFDVAKAYIEDRYRIRDYDTGRKNLQIEPSMDVEDCPAILINLPY